jgi:L-lactate permease
MKLKITIALMVYFVLLIILVLNMEDKSKIIKNSFLVFMIALITALFFVNELVMDYIISVIIRYFYFPTFTSIIVTLILSMAVFINNIYDDEKKEFRRIINYIFSSYIFVSYIVLMFLDVDINSSTALYQGDSLICLRFISRTFILWMIVNVLIKYFYNFLKKE